MWNQRYIRVFSATLALLGFSLLVGHEHQCHPGDSDSTQTGSCWICKSSVDFAQPHIEAITAYSAPDFAELVAPELVVVATAVESSLSPRAPPVLI